MKFKALLLLVFSMASFFAYAMELSVERCTQIKFDEIKYLCHVDDSLKQQLQIAAGMLSDKESCEKAQEWIKKLNQKTSNVYVQRFINKQLAVHAYNENNYKEAWNLALKVPADNDIEFIKGAISIYGINSMPKNIGAGIGSLKKALDSKLICSGNVSEPYTYVSIHAENMLRSLEKNSFEKAQKSENTSDKMRAASYLLLNSSGLKDTLNDGLQLAELAIDEMQHKKFMGEQIESLDKELVDKITELQNSGPTDLHKKAETVKKKYDFLAKVYSQDDLFIFAQKYIEHPDFVQKYSSDINFLNKFHLSDSHLKDIKEQVINKIAQIYSMEKGPSLCNWIKEWSRDTQLQEKTIVTAVKSIFGKIDNNEQRFEIAHCCLHDVENKHLKDFGITQMKGLKSKLPVARWSLLWHYAKCKKKIENVEIKLDKALEQVTKINEQNELVKTVMELLENQSSKYPQLAYKLHTLYKTGFNETVCSDGEKSNKFLHIAAQGAHPQALIQLLPEAGQTAHICDTYISFFKKIKASNENQILRQDAFCKLIEVAKTNPEVAYTLAALAFEYDDLYCDQAIDLLIDAEEKRIQANEPLSDKNTKVIDTLYSPWIKKKSICRVEKIIALQLKSVATVSKKKKKDLMQSILETPALFGKHYLPENIKRDFIALCVQESQACMSSQSYDQAITYMQAAYKMDEESVGMQLADAFMRRNNKNDVQEAIKVLVNLSKQHFNEKAFIKLAEHAVHEIDVSMSELIGEDEVIARLKKYAESNPLRALQIIIDLRLSMPQLINFNDVRRHVTAGSIQCLPDEKSYILAMSNVMDNQVESSYENSKNVSEKNLIYVLPYIAAYNFLNNDFHQGIKHVNQFKDLLEKDFFEQTGPEKFTDDYSKKSLIKQAISNVSSLLEQHPELCQELKEKAQKLMFDLAALWPKKYGGLAAKLFYQRFAQQANNVIDQLDGKAVTPHHLLNSKYIEMLKPYAHEVLDVAKCISKLIHLPYLGCYHSEWGTANQLKEVMKKIVNSVEKYKKYTDSHIINKYLGAFNYQIGSKLESEGQYKQALIYYKKAAALFNYCHASVNRSIALIEQLEGGDELRKFLDEVSDKCTDQKFLLQLAKMNLMGKTVITMKREGEQDSTKFRYVNQKLGEKIIKKLIKENNPAAIVIYARYCLEKGMKSKAKEQLLKITDVSSDGLALLGQYYLKEGMYKDAVDCFTSPIISGPLEKAQACLILATLYKNGHGVPASVENMKLELREHFKTVFHGVELLLPQHVAFFYQTCQENAIEAALKTENEVDQDFYLLGMVNYLKYTYQNLDEKVYIDEARKVAIDYFNKGLQSHDVQNVATLSASALAALVLDNIVRTDDSKIMINDTDEFLKYSKTLLEINPQGVDLVRDNLSKYFGIISDVKKLTTDEGRAIMIKCVQFMADNKIDIKSEVINKLIEKYLMIDNTQHVPQ